MGAAIYDFSTPWRMFRCFLPYFSYQVRLSLFYKNHNEICWNSRKLTAKSHISPYFSAIQERLKDHQPHGPKAPFVMIDMVENRLCLERYKIVESLKSYEFRYS